MKVTVKNKEFYIDKYLKDNLDLVKKSVEKKWDCVFVIDGPEGVAKSTLAKMIGYYLSEGDFSVDNIVFSAEQFSDAIDKAKPKTAIIIDEMVMMGMAADALTAMQKTLVKKFTLIRKKQLYIGLVIPYIFMLNKYFGISRTKFLIHCYTPDWIKRGYFQFYNYDQKNDLYLKGHKYMNYPKYCKASFYGRFTNYTGMFVDEDAYEKKKDGALDSINSDMADIKKIIPTKKTAEALLGIPSSQIYDHSSSQRKLLDNYKANLKTYFGKLGTL